MFLLLQRLHWFAATRKKTSIMKHTELINKMTIEEKCSLLSGGTQFSTKPIMRLNVPNMLLADGPNGLRKQAEKAEHLGLNPSVPATCFPTAATMANSWNEELLETVGKCIGDEARAQRVNVILGPGLNMKRSPLCGRNFEYFSEDPYLAGKLAASYIRGVQTKGVAACPKHFAVNSQEWLRMHSDSVVDERTLREIYLTAFEIAVKEGRPKSLMSAYNRVNGTYASENTFLLQNILRDEWGFDGFVVTDWGGSNDRVKGLCAGGNLEMPTTGSDSDRQVAKAVRNGVLDKCVLDQRVGEYLSVLFDTVIPNNIPEFFDEKEHHELARKAAGESIVLLKNEDHILPLKKGYRVAVIGDFAEIPRYQGAGSSFVNATKVDSPLGCLKKSGVNVIGYAPGFHRYGGEDGVLIKEAVNLAKKADILLLYLGLDELTETEGRDRTHMRLQLNQEQLLEELEKINSNIVVVFSGGAPVEITWLDKCKALIHGYLGGQAGAGAMVDVLVGKRNPSGKLAETWAIKYEDTPAYYYYPGKERTAEYREAMFIGYRYYESVKIPVRFPFGFGMSYTTFEYSDINISTDRVSFTITNTGSVEGAEIAQIYIGKKDSRVFRPVRELKGFAKVYLKPGESKVVAVSLDDKAFRYWNVRTNRWESEAGVYQIMVGESSESILLTGEVTVEGTDAPLPYEMTKLPHYFSGQIQKISDVEFCTVLGKEIPFAMWDRSKPLEMNDTFSQLIYAKSLVGRLIYKVTKKQAEKLRKDGKPDLDALFRYNMPFRAIAKMTGGMVDMAMVESLLIIFNGHFFRGLGGLVRAFFRKGKAERELKQALVMENPVKEVGT